MEIFVILQYSTAVFSLLTLQNPLLTLVMLKPYGLMCKVAIYIFINFKHHISVFNDPILMIFFSKLSADPQDLIYWGNITIRTSTENLHFKICMQIR